MADLVYSRSSFGSSHHGHGLQSRPSLRVFLLHGNLDIWVKDAKNLPNMDFVRKKLGEIFRLFHVGKCDGAMSKNTSDHYVTISVANAVIGRTFVIKNSENPVWMQHFYVPVAHYAEEVHFTVKDNDIVGSEIVGVVGIPVEQIYLGNKVEGTFPVL
ncbi:phospholipase [Lithospermum erythrorhizon]|uniref:Phospholipase n=1 Tax=Lithospermum erythrorhizon TaxID=34254 RepID=A0AAV3PRN3_LITER